MAGGIDWFRWHHGSVNDPKFGLIARRAGASVAEVIAMWVLILEAASAAQDRGSPGDLDFEAIDFALGFDDGKAKTIHNRMIERGMIAENGRVSSWDKRQPKREDETAAERKRRQRERDAENSQQGHDDLPHVTHEPRNVTQCHEDVTQCHDREEKRREEVNPPYPPPLETPPVDAPRKRAANKRGERLPEGWNLPKSWGEWAIANIDWMTAGDARFEAERFADFWHAAAGAKGVKLDWEATWRNWCRSASPPKGRANPPKTQTGGRFASVNIPGCV